MGDGGFDGLSMETEATSQAMTQLGAAGATLSDGWSAARSAIDALGAQLGGGILGQAFSPGYHPAAAELAGAMDTAAVAPKQTADQGQQSVATYSQVDNTSRTDYSAL
jgi:hypothetical protein